MSSPNKRTRLTRMWARRGSTVITFCPNCGEPASHYVPPSLGDAGGYTCTSKVAEAFRLIKDLTT